jgi:FkbM family methyltransferase
VLSIRPGAAFDNVQDEYPSTIAATLFDDLRGSADSLVLFGAGPLGRYALAGLRKVGVEPSAFADNNPQLWNQRIDGLDVLSPTEAAALYGERAGFVVTIYNGTNARDQLRNLGCRAVIPVVALFWKHASVFIPQCGLDLPQNILDSRSEIEACNRILADDASREELRQQVSWRCTLDYRVLSPPRDPRNIYFEPGLIRSRDDEILIDCGAFDGDSVRGFLRQNGERFRHVYATEPDPANRMAFETLASDLPDEVRDRITLWPYAVGKQSARVRFKATSTAGSKVDASGTYEAECRSLDDVLMERQVVPTYIKMDIEGAEPEAIEGAANTLRQHAPVLAACLYHRCDHLWRIPLLINKLAPDYKIFIRRYAEECWELVCYAVPASRLI